MSLDYLIFYESDNKKVRIGSEHDGGYVIADGMEYDCFISCGIADDITFEKYFLEKHKDLNCICYDGTIDKLPEDNQSMTFVKKNITYYNSDKTTNLIDVMQLYNNIFLKMDIETYEYRWLQIMPPESLNKIKQMVIEFHFPFTDQVFAHLDMPLPIDQKTDTLKKITNTHTLIHLHPNNCCGTTLYNGIPVPNVFECTYVRNDIQQGRIKNKERIPTNLDRANIPGEDIILSSYPFVNI
jgi:hypothetical protein